ncbi:MAG TPA: transposase [Nitrospira sp.]|nr:transposase [Nitrospira sp.]
MGEVFLLSQKQLHRITRHVPTPPVDDRRVIRGIMSVIRPGVQWKEAPAADGPPQTLDTRFVRWSRAGMFNVIFREPAQSGDARHGGMSAATPLKAPRPAASLLNKGRCPGVVVARKAA